MKKLLGFGLLCGMLLLSLVNYIPHPLFLTAQNQPNTIQANLTHDVTHIYTADCFDLATAQFIATTGNDTLLLTTGYGEETEEALGPYFMDNITNEDFTDWSVTHRIYNISAFDGRLGVMVLNGTNGDPAGMQMPLANPMTYAYLSMGISYWLYTNECSPIGMFSFAGNDQANSGYGIESRVTSTTDDHRLSGWNATQIDYAGTWEMDAWHQIQYEFYCQNQSWNLYVDGIYNATFLFESNHPALNIDYLTLESTAIAYIDELYINYYSAPFGYVEEGSYVSPVIDLGEYDNYFAEYINVSYVTPSDSDISAHAQFSIDNITWSGWISLVGLPNVTVGFEAGRYFQFYLNLTAGSDIATTPELYSLLVQFEETVLNELPTFQDIAPANNSIGLNPNVPINCTILDADLDLLNVSLYVNDTLVNGASNCANGSFFYYLFHGNYSTTYAFYFNATDGESTTISDRYLCSTKEMPNELPQIGDISVNFDNETMEATISVYVTDPDNDTVDLFLCLPLGSIVDSQTDIANGTIVEFVVLCTYSTSYQYYVNVTDTEDSVQSSLFGFTTGAEPLDEVTTPTIYHITIVIFGLLIVLAIAAANKRRPT